jgi:pimeloyl-ACP methyl ester carboxylesterase
MKKIISVSLLAFFFSSGVFALEQKPPFSEHDGIYAAIEPSYGADYPRQEPDITGRWVAVVGGHGIYRKAELCITKNERMYFASLKGMDDENAEIKVTSISFEENVLKFKIIEHACQYRGVLDSSAAIRGTFVWENMDFGVTFSREEFVKQTEPSKVYNGAGGKIKPESEDYISQEVKFENKKAAITLAGTLTLPKFSDKLQNPAQNETSGFPAVVLISGSGPHNRDAEFLGHKPFFVIADYLTRNGFAVLRYDKRGAGSSSGVFSPATTEDFAQDAAAAIEYLKTRKEIDSNNIGLIGHGEGAAIAAMITAKQRRIIFIVLLAGYAVPGSEVILKRKEMTGKAAKVKRKEINLDIKIAGEIMKITDMGNVGQQKSVLTQYLAAAYDNFTPSEVPKGVGKADFIRMYINEYMDTWMRYFLKYNPAAALEEVKCPVFALWGGKDLQVCPKDNMKALKRALEKSGNRDVTAIIYPRLNHMFQECKTGLPAEYPLIEQTFSQEVLSDIFKWIKDRIVTHTKNKV